MWKRPRPVVLALRAAGILSLWAAPARWVGGWPRLPLFGNAFAQIIDAHPALR